MKYGIIVNGRVTEPVTIPEPLPGWAADASAFLARMFPGKTGWVHVCDDAVPGTLANEDGTFTTPQTSDGGAGQKSTMDLIMERLDAIEAKIDASQPA